VPTKTNTTHSDSDDDDSEDNDPIHFLHIAYGVSSSRLTHSHKQQWHYVMQSLCLWLQVLQHMLVFYVAAEEDLLDNNNSYMLRNTGQGLQRVQSAPRVAKLMHDAIAVVSAAPYPVYGVYKGKLPATANINTNNGNSYGSSSYGSNGSSSISGGVRPFSVPFAKSSNGYTPKRFSSQQQQQQSRPFVGYNASKSAMHTQQQQQQQELHQQQHAVRKHPWVGSTAVHLGKLMNIHTRYTAFSYSIEVVASFHLVYVESSLTPITTIQGVSMVHAVYCTVLALCYVMLTKYMYMMLLCCRF
jgi:Protein of unknown function (DUF2009)